MTRFLRYISQDYLVSILTSLWEVKLFCYLNPNGQVKKKRLRKSKPFPTSLGFPLLS